MAYGSIRHRAGARFLLHLVKNETDHPWGQFTSPQGFQRALRQSRGLSRHFMGTSSLRRL